MKSRPGRGNDRREEHRREGNERVRETFREFAAGSVSDLSFLVNGVVGTRVLVRLQRQKDNLSGKIVVEVGEGDQGLEVSVIASDFPPIQPSTNGVALALPIGLILTEEIEDWEWAGLTSEQEELRKALRWACRYRLANRQPVEERAPTPKVDDEVRKDLRPQIVALHCRHLMEKPRFWGVNQFRYTEQLGTVYFERRNPKNGIRTLVLVKADDDHPLAVLLDVHHEVEVEVSMIFDTEQNKAPIGDLYDLQEAQREFAKYVRSILPKIGYRKKPSKEGARKA